MEKITRANAMFKGGFLCSQSILAVYGKDLGLDRETALKIASGFGGGMGATGQTCGAVTGALMVIGLALGHVSAEDKASKSQTYTAVKDFVRRFEQINGSVNCTQLLGQDLGDPEAYKHAKASGLFESLCPKFVEGAARLLEEIMDRANVY